MAWTYRQSTGRLSHPKLGLVATGYSGRDDGDGIPEPGEGKNDPSKQGERGVGPIPAGKWTIASMSAATDLAHGGDYLRLVPKAGTDTLGRSGFLIHGDSVKRPGSASLGCLIFPRLIRWAIWGSGDRDLEVVP